MNDVCDGIPHRIGACFCLVGKGRDDPMVKPVSETETSWKDCVANSPIEPGHFIKTISFSDPVKGDYHNEDVTSLVVSVASWRKYPKPSDSPFGGNAKLIVKAKGKLDDGIQSFPFITITLRPLKTVLDYEYQGNMNVTGAGEIGYGASDILSLNFWEGNPIPSYFSGDDGAAHRLAYQENLKDFQDYIDDTLQGGVMQIFQETNYFKSADNDAAFSPLTGLELDPTFLPRVTDDTPFDFTRNETWDARYTLPADFKNKFGFLYIDDPDYVVGLPAVIDSEGTQLLPPVQQGNWKWKSYQTLYPDYVPPLNPIFQPATSDVFFNEYSIDQGIAPVIKGWYWDGVASPGKGFGAICRSESFKMTKEIRKRYTFSFNAVAEKTLFLEVNDHKEGNQVIEEDIQSPGSGYIRRLPAVYHHQVTKTSTFDCAAWWRMEINFDELCNWNSRKEESQDQTTGQTTTKLLGAKIKGKIKLSAKQLMSSSYDLDLYSTSDPGFYYDPIPGSPGAALTGVTPSFVFRAKADVYFDEDFVQRYEIPEYDAGEIDWEVTLTEANCQKKPVKFFDFQITSTAELPGSQPGGEGSVPQNSMVYIKDFIVTQVIMP